MNKQTDDIYSTSTLAQKIKESPKVAFLDIDLTLNGEPRVQAAIRTILEENGYSIVFITSRMYDTLLSDASRLKSHSLTRPLSKSQYKNNMLVHEDLATLEHFNGLLDPDAFADTTGLRIGIRQQTGEYVQDEQYQRLEISSKEWRSQVIDILLDLQKQYPTINIKKFEDITNYEKGIVDISPPDFRIQVDFKTNEDKNKLKDIICRDSPPVYALDDSETEKGTFSLFLFPKPAELLKADAVNHIIDKLTQAVNIKPKALTILIAGDSSTDVFMGIYGAKGTNSTFFLPGGSRMYRYIKDKNLTKYHDSDISEWKEVLHQIDPGIYQLSDRKLYIGDDLFPGKIAGESLLHFLQHIYF